jgi:ubiquinone/menaquinone biosynthesis C-methylase UbiE
MNDLPFTGERFVPGARGEIWVEHWHRYHFASRWARGRNVIDVACGEGYGTALLAAHAAQVTGIDVSPEAVAHARATYAKLPNARFECASCTAIPLPDASVDLAVSFETVEHIAEQEAFLDDLARVLKPDGVLLISCPNKLEYSDKRGFTNEFHVRELYRDELERLVGSRFPHARWFGQRPTFFSVIAPEPADAATQAQLLEVAEADPGDSGATISNPMYFLVAASRRPESVAATPPALSVMADRDDWVHHDYEKVMRELTVAANRCVGLERLVDEREALIAKERQAALGWTQERERLSESLAAREATAAKREADLSQLAIELQVLKARFEEKSREVDRRRGWRWWLRLPLVRLGLLSD